MFVAAALADPVCHPAAVASPAGKCCWPGQAEAGGQCEGAPTACPEGTEIGEHGCMRRMSAGGSVALSPDAPQPTPPCTLGWSEDGGMCWPNVGSLDKREIDAPIKARMKQIRRCYLPELRKQRDLSGKVTVKFVIGTDGSVVQADIKSSTLGNDAVESCVLDVFRAIPFPEPKGGGVVIVSYPFIFSPS